MQDEQVGDFKVSLGDELSEVRPPLSSGVDIGPGIDQGLDDLQGGLLGQVDRERGLMRFRSRRVGGGRFDLGAERVPVVEPILAGDGVAGVRDGEGSPVVLRGMGVQEDLDPVSEYSEIGVGRERSVRGHGDSFLSGEGRAIGGFTAEGAENAG